MDLFIDNGYVLDFSTASFDMFTKGSIGIALCQKYKLSKGKSLTAFIKEASECDTNKLLCDLFEYYEIYYEHKYTYDINANIGGVSKSNTKVIGLYKKCKELADRIKNNTIQLSPNANLLKSKYSSEYLTKQYELMIKMQTENPTEAIGKAKEFVESYCKTILENLDIEYDKKLDIGKLTGETMKHLKLMPDNIPETVPAYKEIKAILSSLRTIAINLAALRNSYGSGHGKSALYKGLEVRHAKLAVESAITFVNFLVDTYERRTKN